MTPLKTLTVRDGSNRRRHIDILLEDDQLVAVNKPARLAVIPERWNPETLNLRDILEARYSQRAPAAQSIWVVHRIDAETSGVVLFARTAEMHRELNQLFEAGDMDKSYLAIVRGIPAQNKGSINLPISPHPKQKPLMYIHPSGKPSRTDYEVVETFRHFALLQVRPRTGRTHQIRVHLSAIECPLAVDNFYGGSEQISLADFKTNYHLKPHQTTPPPLIDRLTLHAQRLAFHDPLSNIRRVVAAPIPKDFAALLKALRKYDSIS